MKKQKIEEKREEIKGSIHPTGQEKKVRENEEQEIINEIIQEDKYTFTTAVS